MKKALLLGILASCTTDVSIFDGVDEVATARDLDILYVVDTSANRADYGILADQLDVLQTQLAAIDGQVPNLHVGVVTTDMGIKGTDDELAPSPIRNCAGTGDGGKLTTFDAALDDQFLEDLRGENGTRIRNFAGTEDGDLAAQIGLLTDPATVKTGCEFTQPFEAMRQALDSANNPGFLRANAQLMVVFLTNDDDCSFKTGALFDPGNATLGNQSFRCARESVVCSDSSVTFPGQHIGCQPKENSDFIVPVSEYKTFLEGVKADKKDVIVSAVAGPTTPFVTLGSSSAVAVGDSCSGPGGTARPGVRLSALVNAFGGAYVSSCTQETAYEAITAPLIAEQRSCFPSLRASDGDNCRVIERTTGGVETELLPCDDGGEASCYTLFTDESVCPLGENIGISIDRRSSTVNPNNTIEARCFLQ